jgi:hypothetical protein
MTKPDWATRLQNTFKKKYDQGVSDELKRIVGILESKCKCDIDYCCDFHVVLDEILGLDNKTYRLMGVYTYDDLQRIKG